MKEKLPQYLKGIIIAFILIDVLWLLYVYLQQSSFPLLDPKGFVAVQQRNLLVGVGLFGIAVIIPVVLTMFLIAFRYRDRATHHQKKYKPDHDSHTLMQAVWWIIPTIVVLGFALLTWKTTHSLDHYTPIESTTKPLRIQVVSLQWKWLFIYPDYNIASVNFLAFPEKTPLNFELTADSPMNSFWIPHLGGQIYTMTGMSTKVHLIADTTGEFPGSSAEISGAGFAGMRFIAQSMNEKEFDVWVQTVNASGTPLTLPSYKTLAKPSENTPRMYFAPVEKDLYNTIIMQFMPPSSFTSGKNDHSKSMTH